MSRHFSTGQSNMNLNPNMMTRTSYPLRILVHSDAVGAIIGRSGATIRNITQQTKARIDVHREESPEHQEKVITINGSLESCSEACFKIIEIVNNEITAKFEGVNDPDRDLTLKILAASNLIGRLIGKSGSTIKKIMEQTGTRVNISTNIITESTGEHTVIIVGKLEQIRQAERLISSRLRTAYMSDMGTSLRSMSTSLQTMGQQPYPYNNLYLMPNTSAYLPFYSSLNVPPAAPSLLGFNPSTPNLIGFNQVMQNCELDREIVHIYIPSSMVGAIIGKAGAAIKEMISISGAGIKVATAQTSPEPEPSDRTREFSNSKTICNNNNGNDNDNYNNESSNNNNNNNNNNGNNNNNSETNGADEPSQSCTADSSLTTGSSMSPEASRLKASTCDASQRMSTRKVIITGHYPSQYSAQYMIHRKISNESGKGDISLLVEIYIPSQFVGRIIGKGGSTVKHLQKQTRTIIRLPEDKTSSLPQEESDESETCVQITGDFEGSIAAQRQIRSMIREGLASRQAKNQQTASTCNKLPTHGLPCQYFVVSS